MSNINYIPIEQVPDIHNKTIEHSGGGADGCLDLGKLESVLMNIQNNDYYPTFVDKLTHLFFCTCQFHCFEDGNKRLAITLSAYFLLLNGHMGIARDFFNNMENISYNVASGKIKKELLHKILEAIMNGTYEMDEALKLEIYNVIDE